MTLTTTRPNAYVMRELNTQAEAHAEAQTRRRWSQWNLPFWIMQLEAGNLKPTGRFLARNSKCDTCGSHCPKKTTPTFLYKGNRREYFYCVTCLDALNESMMLLPVCEQVALEEDYQDLARSNGIQPDTKTLKKLRGRMHCLLTAAGVPVQGGTLNGSKSVVAQPAQFEST